MHFWKSTYTVRFNLQLLDFLIFFPLMCFKYLVQYWYFNVYRMLQVVPSSVRYG